MRDITICFVYFRSLTLEHLEASLYALRKQNFSRVNSVVVVDNNTDSLVQDQLDVLDGLNFPVPTSFHSSKHRDPTKTHAWSTNEAVHMVQTSWVFFTRADYLLRFDALEKFTQKLEEHSPDWNGFVTGDVYQMITRIEDCNRNGKWRVKGPQAMNWVGAPYERGHIDTGVWLTRKDAFDAVGGLDERLTAWGYSQTHFQWKLRQHGVEFVCIPEILFYHVEHCAERDLDLATQQLQMLGLTPQEVAR